jgi:hypothetical protein
VRQFKQPVLNIAVADVTVKFSDAFPPADLRASKHVVGSARVQRVDYVID